MPGLDHVRVVVVVRGDPKRVVKLAYPFFVFLTSHVSLQWELIFPRTTT